MQAAVRGRDGKPYVVIYTMRGEMMWVISFRRAREREWRRYAKKA